MQFKYKTANVSAELNTDRFDLQYSKAHKKLDMLILGDCTPYVPFLGGSLRSSGHIVEMGIIEWNVPYAHYQYMGELYLAEDGSSYAEKYAKKFPSGKDLQYHTPGTGAQWFEMAKRDHKKEWVDTVKRIAGGG